MVDVSIDFEDINEEKEVNNKNNKENLMTIADTKFSNNLNKKWLENSTGSTAESYGSSYADSFNYSNVNSAIVIKSSTSSSLSPYSSISASSSTNSSNSNTPNTQIYIGGSAVESSCENRTVVKKKFENKKINFACISSLID